MFTRGCMRALAAHEGLHALPRAQAGSPAALDESAIPVTVEVVAPAPANASVAGSASVASEYSRSASHHHNLRSSATSAASGTQRSLQKASGSVGSGMGATDTASSKFKAAMKESPARTDDNDETDTSIREDNNYATAGDGDVAVNLAASRMAAVTAPFPTGNSGDGRNRPGSGRLAKIQTAASSGRQVSAPGGATPSPQASQQHQQQQGMQRDQSPVAAKLAAVNNNVQPPMQIGLLRIGGQA
jgi:hypothetical protein